MTVVVCATDRLFDDLRWKPPMKNSHVIAALVLFALTGLSFGNDALPPIRPPDDDTPASKPRTLQIADPVVAPIKKTDEPTEPVWSAKKDVKTSPPIRTDEKPLNRGPMTITSPLDPSPATNVEKTSAGLRPIIRRPAVAEESSAPNQLPSLQPPDNVPKDVENPAFLPPADKDKDKAKEPSDAAKKADAKPPAKKWYEKYTIRGYTQVRDNEVLWHQAGSAPAQVQSDRSLGDAQNLLIRRARLIFSGDVSQRVSIYLQPDFVVQTPGSPDGTHFPQIRDWYADLAVDLEKKHRFRIGQSKVPYGWENMQSSSNRLPMERNDAFNGATRNERDLGIFYYWTPLEAQRLYKFATDEGLKGSGNYGVIAWGFYNGQGGSLIEQNNNLHTIFRVNVPYQFDNGEIVELGIQGYHGKYTVLSSPIRALGVGPSIRPAGTLETGNREGHLDQRLGWTAVLLPQPFGLQAEWTIGRGPTLNAAQNAIGVDFVNGGYVMAMYRHPHCWGTTIPFARWQYYKGGYKSERNAPFATINEWEFGFEWQPVPAAEFTMSYLITNRTNTTAIDAVGTIPYQQFVGNVLRMQFQFNY